MVFKDTAGSKQAQIELAMQEKQILNYLQKSAPNKIISPATSSNKLGVKPKVKNLAKPQDWHCLKKLLEETVVEGCLIPNCKGTSLCECGEKLDSLEAYMEEQQKFQLQVAQLQHMKQAKAIMLAQSYPEPNDLLALPYEDEVLSTDTENDDTDDSSNDSYNEDDGKVGQPFGSL